MIFSAGVSPELVEDDDARPAGTFFNFTRSSPTRGFETVTVRSTIGALTGTETGADLLLGERTIVVFRVGGGRGGGGGVMQGCGVGGGEAPR